MASGLFLQVLIALFAIVQGVRYGRGALLFIAPRVRVVGDPGATPRSPARLRTGGRLEELGFVLLGVRHERGALGALDREIDSYVNAARGVYADVLEGRSHESAQVAFFTPLEDGGAVLTANFARRSVMTDRLQAGSLIGAAPEALLATHEIALRRFAARGSAPHVAEDLESRLESVRSWYRGAGRSDLRRDNAMAFAIALIAVLLLASAVRAVL